ncbi:hypothetical protein EMIHUDRAFT_71786, partial [Emiliania huxleyi CCMP1516]|uniref:E3 ubiquitin-protein ligase synoviolin-like TPR repeats domain-containing protein n=2 Tax=Emiliania huxleyi TaxID=2903 RepID=A0A0D3KBB1_EMIH1
MLSGSRFTTYLFASTALVVGVTYHTHSIRRQFYPTVIALTTNKVASLVLANAALALTLLVGRILKSAFFGRLREAEVEHLYERAWYAITETCLAMTIFREEFNISFCAMFCALLFIKSFHWLLQDRIAFLEQAPEVRLVTHLRVLGLTSALAALDAAFLYHALSSSIARGPSVLLLFAFEYLLLSSTIAATFVKYALYVNEARLGGRWDEKGVYLFYLDLATDLFHMLIYLGFFHPPHPLPPLAPHPPVRRPPGLPLHIMRDLYLTCRSFRSRVVDFLRYRAIMRNMQERFADATEQ